MASFQVYAAIAAVTAEMSKEGIAKGRSNQQQGYKFRGIDDVYNALSPMLAAHKLCIMPRIINREVTERVNAKGTALFYVTVEAEFDFVSAEDGSKHVVKTFGEAMDSADKATNKAMSAAYKYAAMQTFCIPTEGDNDAESATHEVIPSQPSPPPVKQTSAAEKKRQLLQIDNDLLDCSTLEQVKKVAAHWQTVAKAEGWSQNFKLAAKAKFDQRRAEVEHYDDDGFPGADTVSDIQDQFPGAKITNERMEAAE